MSHYRTLKHFGQHLLNQPAYLHKIVAALNPKENDLLVEVGPGLGALTKEVLPHCHHLHVVEIDKRFIEYLSTQFDPQKLTVHAHDATRFNFAALLNKQQEKLRIFGNLPYNVSTPLLFHFLNFKDHIQDMLFLLQSEVVERMAASPGNKIYGRLSVMIQYHCHVSALFDVPPQAFSPPPKVNSSVVKLTPYQRPKNAQALNYDLFKTLVNQAFQQRRKTIRNALQKLVHESLLTQLNIDPMQRAETLSVEDYVNISNAIETTS